MEYGCDKMINKSVLEFYQKTSLYTELGLYSDFAKKLPNDIKTLCLLQRNQIIHPIAFKKKEVRNSKNCFWGDMTQISNMNLLREDDIFPSAISMLSELIRKDPKYSMNRKAKDKIFVTCRGQALLLVAILKAKGIPARVRSGFASYPSNDGIYWDHWVTEYYNTKNKKWILVDADCCCNDNLDFDIYNIPENKFLSAAQVWIKVRENNLDSLKIGHAYYSKKKNKLTEILTTALFYDFHCLMNDEIIYLHYPKYLKDNNFKLSKTDLKEIDELARLMIEPDKNFKKIYKIWNSKSKFRIMTGGTINE